MDALPHEVQLASFRLGNTLFAVDIMRIREIIQPQRIAQLPQESRMLEGMINLRGAVMPVMNLRNRFNMPPRSGQAGKLMVVTIAGCPMALAVDDVDEVLTVPLKDIAPAPDMVAGVGAEYLIGVCLCNNELYMILNIDTICSAGERREWTAVARGVAV